jgi:protein-S-isoprenylcysteine O-methyltransferase Ste14
MLTNQIHLADLAIYIAHAAFWGVFVVARITSRRTTQSEPDGPVPREKRTAKYSRLVMATHFVAFSLMYTGIANAIFSGRVPDWFAGQRAAGAIIIGIGAVLGASALLYFRSWRFRAALNEGHQLATGGPFAVLRHPIYMALNLLALGSALWIPSPLVWAGFVLMLLGGDLRARAEEALLGETFGADYQVYRKKTWRFIPWIY